MITRGAIKLKMSVYNPEMVHGSKLMLSDVERLISLLKSKTIAERKKIVGLEPRIADVILAGAMIVNAILKKTKMKSVTVSDRRQRHGLMVDRFGL